MGPRDGFQAEETILPPVTKAVIIERLTDCGLTSVEAGSFSSATPQMADTAEVYRHIRRRPGIQYPALVPDLKGLHRAMDCGVDQVSVTAPRQAGGQALPSTPGGYRE